MIRENCVGENIDGEDGGESFETASNPLASKGVVIPGNLIDSGETSSADASLHAMDYSNFVMSKLIGTFRPNHDLAPMGYRVYAHDTGKKENSQETMDGTF